MKTHFHRNRAGVCTQFWQFVDKLDFGPPKKLVETQILFTRRKKHISFLIQSKSMMIIARGQMEQKRYIYHIRGFVKSNSFTSGQKHYKYAVS